MSLGVVAAGWSRRGCFWKAGEQSPFWGRGKTGHEAAYEEEEWEVLGGLAGVIFEAWEKGQSGMRTWFCLEGLIGFGKKNGVSIVRKSTEEIQKRWDCLLSTSFQQGPARGYWIMCFPLHTGFQLILTTTLWGLRERAGYFPLGWGGWNQERLSLLQNSF